jgi:hypothetical protein
MTYNDDRHGENLNTRYPMRITGDWSPVEGNMKMYDS